jgi:predicted ABC-type ATPase
MGRCGQIVMGPAGSGKSTYCANLAEHMQAIQRSVHVVNLDPAADQFNYHVRATRAVRALLRRARASAAGDRACVTPLALRLLRRRCRWT